MAVPHDLAEEKARHAGPLCAATHSIEPVPGVVKRLHVRVPVTVVRGVVAPGCGWAPVLLMYISVPRTR